MKNLCLGFFSLLSIQVSLSQGVNEKIIKAFAKFEKDPQLKAALSSLYIINAKTGGVVFEKNSGIGLAPASTQKIVIGAAAYELLGKDFRYKTEFGINENGGETDLYIKPSGDPTLGSWRWKETKEKQVLERIINGYKRSLKSFSKIFIINDSWNFETIPAGWVWEDIGNFYGAGAFVLNWRENQFDIILRSGKVLYEPVKIISTEPDLYRYQLRSDVIGVSDTADNTSVYFAVNGGPATIRGTIPVNRNRFVVAGAMPDPLAQLLQTIVDSLKNFKKDSVEFIYTAAKNFNGTHRLVHTEVSPPLDSIIYWLNKKSVNLYAEALLKTMALQKFNMASTEKGVHVIKSFWRTKGIDTTELNIQDGSGLSPSNRVSTRAEVSILQYAKKQAWFQGFFHSLPVINGMKMKSGSIKDVKSFAGYHTAKSGKEYIYSFIVNNYHGATNTLVQKMYQVLDVLK